MRITLFTEGGLAHFPGLHRPVAISLEELPSESQTQLRSCIDSADFFNLPSQPQPPTPGAADYRTYVITIETPQRTHTVAVREPVKDECMRRLIQLLRSVHRNR